MSEPIPLAVAGSDPTAGAGLELDLLVFFAHGLHGAAVATALTVQDSRSVRDTAPVDPVLFERRLETVLADLDPDGVKIGLLPSAAHVERAARSLDRFQGPLVLDPVRAPTAGEPFLDEAGRRALLEHLVPRADLLTPNAEEAAWLLGARRSEVARDPEGAARALLGLGARRVLLKGGHLLKDAPCVADRYAGPEGAFALAHSRRPGPTVRGTGCALSSAYLARRLLGAGPEQAIEGAVRFVVHAIRRARKRGSGRPTLGLPGLAP